MQLNQLQKRLLIKELNNFPLVSYEPARLMEWPTGWQIEYRIINPDSGRMEKKRLRFEKIRKRLGETKARKFAKIYCNAINEKLESGWNPYLEGKNAKSFHQLTDVLDTYLKEKELDLKNGSFSKDSMRSYRSYIKIFTEWIQSTANGNIYVGGFTTDMALGYLDHLYVKKQLSPKSWNNYLTFSRALWNWLIEKNYCSENVFIKIKPKKEMQKERTIIPEESNKAIIQYFKQHDPAMVLVCGLIYNSFMRPAEICRTQMSDIKLIKNGIYLQGNKTKNKKSRWCLLPPHLINMIIDMGIGNYPDDYYLFSKDLKPGKTPIDTRNLDKYWEKMRKAIGIPMCMKLYSYRDTGITDLKKAGYANIFISSITGHLNSDEIETYTHIPDANALQFIMTKSKQL